MKTPHTTVADLIKFLQTQPQEMVVLTHDWENGHSILSLEQIEQETLQAPDEHGVIHYYSKITDRPQQTYLTIANQ